MIYASPDRLYQLRSYTLAVPAMWDVCKEDMRYKSRLSSYTSRLDQKDAATSKNLREIL